MSSIDTLIVSENQLDLRLDKLLSEHFFSHSRTYFQYLIEEGCVLVNGKRVKKREKLKLGDEIEVCFRLTPEISLEPQEIPLDIVYEDEHLLCINKPAGMVVHPAPGHPSYTFVNALLYHCKIKNEPGDVRPGIVHRLDKDTSGVLLAAKTVETHQKLIEAFSQRKVQKTYLAICIGNPKDATINAPLKRHPIHRKEMAVSLDGKEAISKCRTLFSNGVLSLAEIDLITGRTHQIRVHLKHHGTPVLGDPVYGSTSWNQKYSVQRQLLHAHHIKFIHPILQTPLELTAKIPQDMQSFIDKLKFSKNVD